jgi:hypothetical protein
MAPRDTFIAAVATAAKTKVATDLQTEMVRQSTINAAGCDVGYNNVSGNYANLKAACDSATKAALAAGIAAEAARQIAVTNARDVLRNSGDLGPA